MGDPFLEAMHLPALNRTSLEDYFRLFDREDGLVRLLDEARGTGD